MPLSVRRRSPFLDNLTHALAGAAIAKAGAERFTPLATATLVLAANAPDVDMLSFVRGEYYALAFRRGLTHGWAAMVVLPFIITAAVLAWDRWIRRARDPGAVAARAGPLLALSVAGLLTHPTLDWMNVYGMRWWLPFEGAWTYGDALFIVDPWIWLGLGGPVFLASRPGRAGLAGWALLAVLTTTLVWVALPATAGVVWTVGLATVLAARWRRGAPEAERVAEPAGGRNHGRPGGATLDGPSRTTPAHPIGTTTLVRPGGTTLVRASSAAVVVYIAAMVAGGTAARRDVMRTAAARGLAVKDVMVAPVRGNPFVGEVEVRTDDGFVPGVYRWLGSPRVELFPEAAVPLRSVPEGLPADRAERILSAARAMPAVRRYLVWSRFPYVHVEPDAGGWRVHFGDARYDGQPEAGGLGGLIVHVPEPEAP